MLPPLWFTVAILTVHHKVTCSSGMKQFQFCSNVFSRQPIAVSSTESTLYFEVGSSVFSIPLSNVDNVNGRLTLLNITHRIGALSEGFHQHHHTNGSEAKPFAAFTHQGRTHVWDFVNHQVLIVPKADNESKLTVSMDTYFACGQWLNTTNLNSGGMKTPSSSSTIKAMWNDDAEWTIIIVATGVLALLAIICLIGCCQINQHEPSQLWTPSFKKKITSKRHFRSRRLSSPIKTTLNSLSKSNITDTTADSTRNISKKSLDSSISSFVPVKRKKTLLVQAKKCPKPKYSPLRQPPKSQFGYITSEAYSSPFESSATVSQLDAVM